MPGKVKNIAGQKFGRVAVISFAGIRNHKAMWTCSCECGGVFNAAGIDLRRGNTRSCGCYVKDLLFRTSVTHGATIGGVPTGAYRSWCSMKQRCDDPKAINYDRYGARGIRYCERWGKFENFLADMGERPTGCSLERKNPSGMYEPANCEWIPNSQQAANTRVTVRLRLDGDLVHQAEAARRLGVHPTTLTRWRRTPSLTPVEYASRLEFTP
jgi:hypothetical protein